MAQLSKTRVNGHSLARIAGLNPAGRHGYLSVVSVVLSVTDLCDRPITRPEESYGLWYVIVYDLETSGLKRPWPVLGCFVWEGGGGE